MYPSLAQPVPSATERRVPSRTRRPPGDPPAVPGDGGAPWVPSRALSAFVWGANRDANDLVAYALARELDPALFWLEVESSSLRDATSAPARRGWIRPDHIYLAREPADLESPALPSRGLSELVQVDEPRADMEAISSFLTLPNVVQEIVSLAHPAPPPVIAFVNVERVPSLLRRADGPNLWVLEALREASVSSVFVYTGAPPVDRLGFDLVLRVDVPEVRTWDAGEIVCERSYPQTPFQTGSAVALSRLPFIARVFDRFAPGGGSNAA